MSENVFINIPGGQGAGGGIGSINGALGPSIALIPGSGIAISTVGNNITITNTGSAPTGTANTVAGFDSSGNLYTIPGSNADNNGQLIFSTNGTPPSDNVNQLILNAGISTSLTGGYEGAIVGPNLSSTMAFMSAYNAEVTFASGYVNSGGVGIYQDQSNVLSGASIQNYSSFDVSPTIAGTLSGGYQGLDVFPNINVSIGNYQGVVNSPNLNSGFSTTGGVDGFRDSGTLSSGSTASNYNSFGASPNLNGVVTNQYNGLQINPNGSATMQNAYGINITMSNLTGVSQQGIVGINSDSAIQLNAESQIFSSEQFQIINRIESLATVASGSPATGTDTLGNDFAGDLDAQDNIANGPTGGLVGWTGVGFISELIVGSGKTVDTANIFLSGSSLPAPTSPETDGGTITNLSMIKTAAPLNQGGSLIITNLYGLKLDTVAGSFSGAATNAWGLYIEDPNLPNYIQGSLGIGNTTPSSRLDLPAVTATAGSSSMKITSGTLMTTPEAGAIESDGTHLYWTNNSGLRKDLSDAGADTALDNLTATAINQTLNPGTSNTLNLGSNTNTSFASNIFSTATAFENVNAGSSTLFGQAFVAQSSGSLTAVDFAIYYNSTPITGNIAVTIQTDSGGFPSGTVIGTGTYNASGLTLYPGSSPVVVTSIPISSTPLTASTQYHVVFDFSSLSSGSQVYFQGTDPSPSGIGASYAESHVVGWSKFDGNTENFYFNVKTTSIKTWANGYFGTSVQTPALLLNGSTSGTLTLTPAATTTSYPLIMPAAQGTSGQTLSNNGSGVLTWVTPSSGSGTVTSVSVVSANGFAGTVATSTTTPAITLSTSITGVLKGNGTAISAATAGTDYVIPSGSITGTAANITATSNSTLTTLSALSLPTTQLTGTLQAAQEPAHTGDVTNSAGSLALTLATVNTNTGSFGSSTSIPNFTVNGKGLITAAGSNVVIAPAGTLSGTTLNSTVVTSSLTALGSQSQALNMNSHLVNNVSPGVSGTDAVNLNQLNAAVQGLNPAVAVQAATTAASDTSGFTYNNGISGIGATLTSNSTNTALTVDGFTFTTLGQRLLVKNDTQSPSGAFNGIYYVTQVQALALPIILTRALDYDQPSDINNTGAIPVINGTVNGTTQWVETALVNTVGTDPLTFTKFSGNPASFLLAANNLSDVSSKSTSFNNLSPMTTGGDLIYGGASGTGTRLANGSSGQVLTSGGGTSAPSWQVAPSAVTGSYWSGFNSNGQFWTVTQTTFTSDFANGNSISLSNHGTPTITVTAASGSLPGITFTPASSSAVYIVTASVVATAAVNNWNMLQLTDGSNVITQRDWLPNSSLVTPVQMTGIYAPGTGSSVTVKIQGASLSGTMTLGNTTGDTITSSIEWTLVRIA